MRPQKRGLLPWEMQVTTRAGRDGWKRTSSEHLYSSRSCMYTHTQTRTLCPKFLAFIERALQMFDSHAPSLETPKHITIITHQDPPVRSSGP